MSLAGADDGDARVRRGGLTEVRVRVRVRVKVRVRESSGGLTKARLARLGLGLTVRALCGIRRRPTRANGRGGTRAAAAAVAEGEGAPRQGRAPAPKGSSETSGEAARHDLPRVRVRVAGRGLGVASTLGLASRHYRGGARPLGRRRELTHRLQ
eukprot:scaffold20621_cov67-Phaeocystis_antarctica.AAC.3